MKRLIKISILSLPPIIFLFAFFWQLTKGLDVKKQNESTKQIITNFFKNKGIPGEIVEHEWKDFSHNRNLALKSAFNKADYAFIFDADDCINGDFKLPEVMDKDGYNLKFGKDGCVYERTLLVNNRIEWEYVGVLHEVIVCKEPGHQIVLFNGFGGSFGGPSFIGLGQL